MKPLALLFLLGSAVAFAQGLPPVGRGTNIPGQSPITNDGGVIGCTPASASSAGCFDFVGGKNVTDAGVAFLSTLGVTGATTISGVVTLDSATNPSINLTNSANGGTQANISNAAAGGFANLRLLNDAATILQFGIYGTTHTPYGAAVAGGANLYFAGALGLVIMVDNASGALIFATGGNAEVGRFTAAGALTVNTALTKGTFTLSTGTATKTVASGAQCVCGLTTGTVWPKCAVSATTLTITGTGSDTGTYLCL